jgi:transposase
MVHLEERFMIRDLHRKGLSVSEIARRTGRDRKTIQKVIQAGVSPAGDTPGRRRRKKGVKLAAFEGYLKQRIAEGVLNTRKLLRELKARGYQGGLTQLILYVQPYRTSREERAVMRYETQPGQQAQVDWSSFGYISVDGRQQRLYAFVMTLGYSRMMYVEFTTSTEVSRWLRCHQRAFEYFGGVPREILHDNLKTAVLSRGGGGKIYYLLELALALSGFCAVLRVQPLPVQTLSRPDQRQSRAQHSVCPAEFLGGHALRGRGRPQPPGPGIAAQCGECAHPRHNRRHTYTCEPLAT